jgi:16S rRNA (guanine527-N7)-methyltransferase
MTEEEARDWIRSVFDVSRETFDRIEGFVALLTAEATRQNLIAASTVPAIWVRHLVDSAQLLPLGHAQAKSWIDLGSGAGFPGLIVAALSDLRVTLIDSRKKRVAFLVDAAELLGVSGRTTIHCARAETIADRKFDVISARAFAPLDRLLPIASRFARTDTIWLLPKGRSAVSELEAIRSSWQGRFRIEPSITDPEASIIVATQVKPRGNR